MSIITYNVSSTNELLRVVRESLNMTQKEIAKKAGIDLRQYQRFESGERNILNASFTTAVDVIEALGMDVAAFRHGDYILKTESSSTTEAMEQNIDRTVVGEEAIHELECHRKAAIFVKGKNPGQRNRQIEVIKNSLPDIEIVKVYQSTYANMLNVYEEMLQDAQNEVFDLVLATKINKFMGGDSPHGTEDRVMRIRNAGVACYFTQDMAYFGSKAEN